MPWVFSHISVYDSTTEAGTAAGNVYGVASSAQVQSVKVLSDQGSGQWSWSYGARQGPNRTYMCLWSPLEKLVK